MVGLLDNPEYWRARAEDTRTIADALTNKESKQIMLEIVKDYECLAARAEERLKRRSTRKIGSNVSSDSAD
jgi:hypothetical protein